MKFIFVTFVISVFFLVGCQKEQGAEDVLTDFVGYRFKQNQDIEYLITRSTGKLKLALLDLKQKKNSERVEDREDFSNFIHTNKLLKRSFKILFKKCEKVVYEQSGKDKIKNGMEKDICYITYTVGFDRYDKRLDEDNAKRNYLIEVKKIATLEKISNKWMISDINNIKTYIDSKKDFRP